jgi:transcriptional regulator with XRE-family HTH domain
VSTALAERVRTLRKQLKMSQEELAERSGVSLGSLKRFENSGKISLESLLKLIHLLGRLNEFDNILLPKEDHDDIKKLFSK